jgi:hypothetical protein
MRRPDHGYLIEMRRGDSARCEMLHVLGQRAINQIKVASVQSTSSSEALSGSVNEVHYDGRTTRSVVFERHDLSRSTSQGRGA